MSTTIDQQLVTPDEFLIHPDFDRCELVRGKMVEQKMSMESVWIAGEVFAHIRQYIRSQELGTAFPDGMTYQCFSSLDEDPFLIRRPDCSFIRKGRVSAEQFTSGHCRVVPDLVVEVVSPNDAYSDIQQRVHEFIAVGTSLVWVIDPVSRVATVFHRDGKITEVTVEGEISGEDVLPGFRCRLNELLPSDKNRSVF